MLLLGVVQAQAFETAAAGSYDLLSTTILTSSASSVTFSSLNTLAAGYQHLQLRVVGRADRAANDDVLQLRFNGVTSGGNYKAHQLTANGSSVGSSEFGESDRILTGFSLSAANATANAFAGLVIDILDFANTSKNTTIRKLGGRAANGNEISLTSGVFLSTNAITSITLAPFLSSNLVSGSRFSLYGIRG